MNRLLQECRVAARGGVAASAFLSFCAALAFILVMREAPLGLRTVLAAILAFFVFLYGFLVAYVFADAKRRGMRPWPWALVAGCVPNALGFLAYFLLREPLLKSCPACGATVGRNLAFCAQCGSPLGRTCPSCRRPLEAAWKHCAHCGATLPGTATPAGTE
jgi:double zinc ribbon protein